VKGKNATGISPSRMTFILGRGMSRKGREASKRIEHAAALEEVREESNCASASIVLSIKA